LSLAPWSPPSKARGPARGGASRLHRPRGCGILRGSRRTCPRQEAVMRFRDHIVVVTGGGYGIGRGIALAFGREGAHVVLAARSRGKLEAVAGALRELGTIPMVAEVSVSDEAAVAAMVRAAESAYGRIDVLVNNA